MDLGANDDRTLSEMQNKVAEKRMELLGLESAVASGSGVTAGGSSKSGGFFSKQVRSRRSRSRGGFSRLAPFGPWFL